MRLRNVFIILLSILLCACAEYRMRRDVIAFQKIQFELPDTLKSEYRLVSFFDSTACNTCGYNSLYLWGEMMDFASAYPDKLTNYFIFSPSSKDLYLMEEFAKSGKYTIWLDSSGWFLKNNPDYARNPLFATFLLDTSGRAVLVGEPLFNETLYQLYREVIGMDYAPFASMIQNADLAADPSLAFDTVLYDLGQIERGSAVDVDIIAENTTAEDIVIMDVRSGCDCISVGGAVMKIIPAGGSEVLTLKYSAAYTGDFFYKISFINSYSGLPAEVAVMGSVR